MGWEFAVLLLGALVASVVLSLWQQRRYLAVVNEMARANAGRQLRLVSGRSKGRLRGAVAVLVVDPSSGEITDARAMTGATVFSQLRPAPHLLGPVAGVAARAGDDKHLREAVESALAMVPRRGDGPPATPRPQPGGKIRLPRAQN